MDSNKPLYFEPLDGLRGLAALVVLLSHTSNNRMYYLPGLDFSGVGKSGVYLFFLLSAFLLTSKILQLGETFFSPDNISRYFKRRFLRIYPLYLLLLSLGVITSFATAYFQLSELWKIPFELTLKEFFSHLFLLEGKGVTWSIAVEFKFYFVLPLLAYLLFKVCRFKPLVSIGILSAMLLLSQLLLPQQATEVNDIRLLAYIPVFLIGMVLALVQHKLRTITMSATAYRVFSSLGLIGLFGIVLMIPSVFSLLFFEVKANYFHKMFIEHGLFWSAVILCALNVKGLLQRFLSTSFLRFLGTISFSLYLLHSIFIEFVKVMELNSYVSAWMVLGVSCVASYFTYRFIEAPALNDLTKSNLVK